MAVGATAIWRVRPGGNNANGGGYDPGISSPGTDYSQQNGSRVTFNGTTITASGTTATLTISGYTVAATDVANCLQITSGTNLTAGFYFIISVNVGTNSWTLDRNPVSTGTGSALVGRMGGGWADPWQNCSSTFLNPASPPVPGNIIYILGSGIPNPSSYSYDYQVTTAQYNSTMNAGNTTAGPITLANDPQTPGYKAPPDTTGGMPVLRSDPSNGPTVFATNNAVLKGLWLVAGLGGSGVPNAVNVVGQPNVVIGCVFDQVGLNCGLIAGGIIVDCEVFSSAGGSGQTTPAIGSTGGGGIAVSATGCNIHDCTGPGINPFYGIGIISNNIIAKCSGAGLTFNDQSAGVSGGMIVVYNNTIDGNSGDGIVLNGDTPMITVIYNNIISNQTGVSKYGINVTSNTAAQNSTKGFIDYNTFYNNTSNYSGINAGPHDTALGTSPYVAQSTENYALA